MNPLLITLLATLDVRTDSMDPENMDPQLREANANAGKLRDERDQAQGRVDALEGEQRTDEQIEAEQLAYFNERTPLVQLAQHFNVDAVEDQTNEALRKSIAMKATPSAKADASDAYYSALVDVARDRLDTADEADKADPFASLGTGFGKPSEDADRADSTEIPSATRANLESIAQGRAS